MIIYKIVSSLCGVFLARLGLVSVALSWSISWRSLISLASSIVTASTHSIILDCYLRNSFSVSSRLLSPAIVSTGEPGISFALTLTTTSSVNISGLKGSPSKMVALAFFVETLTFSCSWPVDHHPPGIGVRGTKNNVSSGMKKVVRVGMVCVCLGTIFCNFREFQRLASWLSLGIVIYRQSTRIVFSAHVPHSILWDTLTILHAPVSHLLHL